MQARIRLLIFLWLSLLLVFKGLKKTVQHLHLQRKPPALTQGILIGNKVQFFGISLQTLLQVEIKTRIKNGINDGVYLTDACIQKASAQVGQADIAAFELVINTFFKATQTLHIGLQQKAFAGVELAQIEIVDLEGKFVVDALMAKMARRQLLADHVCNELIALEIKGFGYRFGASWSRRNKKNSSQYKRCKTTHDNLSKSQQDRLQKQPRSERADHLRRPYRGIHNGKHVGNLPHLQG